MKQQIIKESLELCGIYGFPVCKKQLYFNRGAGDANKNNTKWHYQ